MNKFEKFLASDWQDLAYGCALIERMQPNYSLFSELCDYGDDNILRSALDIIWSCCAGQLQQVDFAKQLDKLESVTPEIDQFESFGVRPGVDACVGLSLLLEVCGGQQDLDISALEQLYLSTIDAYIEFTGEINEELDHPLNLDAQNYFSAARELLVVSDGSRSSAVKELKSFSREHEVSNIGIEKV